MAKPVALKDVYQPIKDQFVVEQFITEKTAGGIIIPESAQERDYIAQVVATGPECKYIKIGDYVMVSALRKVPVIPIQSQNHFQFVEQLDLLGVVTNEEFIKAHRAELQTKADKNAVAVGA